MIFFHGSPKRIPETAHARCVRTAVRPTAIDVEVSKTPEMGPKSHRATVGMQWIYGVFV